MRYVALLRGVNAGGNRRVPMEELRQLFEKCGFLRVSTYINSGNVIFESTKTPDTDKVQVALEEHFGFDIDTLILPGNTIQEIAAAIPKDWTNDALTPEKSGQKSDVAYLLDDINSPTIIEKIGYRPEVETMIYVDHAILSSITRKNQTKSSLARSIGGPLYKRMTVRNITTAKKLAELVRENG